MHYYAGRHFSIRVKHKKEYFAALDKAFENYDEFWAESF